MDREKIMENSKDNIRRLVKEEYSGIAKGDAGGCASSCCTGSPSLVSIMDRIDQQERGEALS